jgi:hypothetical protein
VIGLFRFSLRPSSIAISVSLAPFFYAMVMRAHFPPVPFPYLLHELAVVKDFPLNGTVRWLPVPLPSHRLAEGRACAVRLLLAVFLSCPHRTSGRERARA